MGGDRPQSWDGKISFGQEEGYHLLWDRLKVEVMEEGIGKFIDER